MRVRDLFESNKGTKSTTVELESENDTVEIEIDFKYEVEPHEKEDGHAYADGGASMVSWKVKPFKFEDKNYSSIPLDLIGNLEFPKKFEKDHKPMIKKATEKSLTATEAKEFLTQYMNFMFVNFVADDIDVPTKNYPATR